jgi:hypothetical protein
VEQAGDEVLAGSGLAVDQHRRAGRGDAADQVADPLDRRAVADE